MLAITCLPVDAYPEAPPAQYQAMDDKASRMRDEEELATRRELEAAEDHVAQLRSRLTAKASR